MSKAHSTLGGSVIDRCDACPGSRRAAETMPNIPSPFAAEGTVAHELGEHALKIWLNHRHIANWRHWLADQVGKQRTVDGFTITVTRAITDHVAGYVEYVTAQVGLTGRLMVETRVDLSSIWPGAFGTSDAIIYDPTTRALTGIDLKFGAGVGVDPVENSQGLFYMLGAALALKLPVASTRFVIYQPRAPFGNAAREWVFPSYRLFDFALELARIGAATEAENPEFNPGEHCQFCPAAPLCRPLWSLVESALKEIEKIMQAQKYDPAEAAALMRRVPIITSAVRRFAEYMAHETANGRGPAGWKIVTGRGERTFTDPAAVRALLLMHGIDESDFMEPPAPPSLQSPAVIERAIGKEKFRQILGPLVVKTAGKTALAPPEDPRAALPVTPSTSMFTAVAPSVNVASAATLFA